MRIENGQINLSSSHDLKSSSEVKIETRIHNKTETHDGNVFESERVIQGEFIDRVSLSSREVNTEELIARAEQGIRLSGQGISISTNASFRSGPSDIDGNSQISATLQKHYSRMNIESSEFSRVEISKASLNRSTGASTVRDLQAEFLIKIMELGLGRSLKEMSPEELGKMGLSEDNIMRIRGYFNEQDAQRAQQQADINKQKGRQFELEIPPVRDRAPTPSGSVNVAQTTKEPSNTDGHTNTQANTQANTQSDTAPTSSANGATGNADSAKSVSDNPQQANTVASNQANTVASDNAAVSVTGAAQEQSGSDDQGSDDQVTVEQRAASALQNMSGSQGSMGDEASSLEPGASAPGQTVAADSAPVTSAATNIAPDQPEGSEDEEPIPPGMVRRTTTLTESRESIFREEEHTRFSAQGKVLTSDGREIDIELDVGMSRKFESTELAQSIKVLKDPLVVNFDGPAVALDDHRTFMFDIDMDGEEDQLAQLKSGSGFLALDKNGDGIINDGSELFGAQSGNGFADLAEYDEDGDGFIDEDDSVFNQLRIWVPGDDGESELFALLDKDVGAIHLNHVETEFALNRMADNENMGYVRSSGVFLKESGGVGSVQQIDLSI